MTDLNYLAAAKTAGLFIGVILLILAVVGGGFLWGELFWGWLFGIIAGGIILVFVAIIIGEILKNVYYYFHPDYRHVEFKGWVKR